MPLKWKCNENKFEDAEKMEEEISVLQGKRKKNIIQENCKVLFIN